MTWQLSLGMGKAKYRSTHKNTALLFQPKKHETVQVEKSEAEQLQASEGAGLQDH